MSAKDLQQKETEVTQLNSTIPFFCFCLVFITCFSFPMTSKSQRSDGSFFTNRLRVSPAALPNPPRSAGYSFVGPSCAAGSPPPDRDPGSARNASRAAWRGFQLPVFGRKTHPFFEASWHWKTMHHKPNQLWAQEKS